MRFANKLHHCHVLTVENITWLSIKEARYVQVKIFTMFQYPSNLLDLLASLMIQALISFIGTNFFVTINLVLSHSLSFLLVILLSHAHVL